MTEPIMISVLMGVYNSERYLASSISSILLQTYKNFEFIIVNDGSTDKSAEIIEKFALKDSRIKVINHDNKGLTKSLNIAARHAKGKYLARQDADDISLPRRFKTQINYLKKHPDVKVLGTSNFMMDDNGKVINIFLRPRTTEKIKEYMPVGNQLCHGSVLMDKKFFFDINGYDENYRFAQDYELWFRILNKGYEIHNLRCPLYLWRIHENSIAGSVINKQKETVQEILNTYTQTLFPETCIYDVKENVFLDKYNLYRGLLHGICTSFRYNDLGIKFIKGI